MKSTIIHSALFILLGSPVVLKSQSALSVIAVAGKNEATAKIQLAWTLGEIAVQQYSNTKATYTEGFHQPATGRTKDNGMEVASIEENQTEEAVRHNVYCFPNPVSSTLHVARNQECESPSIIQLVGPGGQPLVVLHCDPNDVQFEIDMSTFISGTYILQFLDPAGNRTIAQPIIKQ